jgi:DNA-binding transcriptional LysR family regulator
MSASRIRRYLRHGTAPQLQVFDSIVRFGSFSRAAEELHMAQPTVSAQVKKLSEAMGLPLFEQIGKRVYPTQAGLHLQQACAEVFDAFERLDDALAGLRDLTTGRLQLAVSTTGKYFAPRLLAGFNQRYPGVEISLQIHNRRTLLERFAENLDDLYIFANPPESNTVTQLIQPNPMVVFARSDHPLASQRRIRFEQLESEPFLMREAGSGTRMVAEREFARRGLRPSVRMELSTNEAVKQAILAGLGISILSHYTLGLDTEQRRLVTLDVEGFPLESNWYFAYPVGKRVQPPARAFMDFVRAEVGVLTEDRRLAA